MQFLDEFLFVVLSGALNRLRGTNFRQFFLFLESPPSNKHWVDVLGSKGAVSIFWGILSGFYYALNYEGIFDSKTFFYLIFAVSAGLWIWAALGWGRYFIAYNGSIGPFMNEKEVPIVDFAADKAIKYFTKKDLKSFIASTYDAPYRYTDSHRFVRLWGAIAMSLRGLFLFPLVFFMALSLGAWMPLLLSPLGALQGFAYYITGSIFNRNDRYSEWMDRNHIMVSEVLTGSFVIAPIIIGAMYLQ